MKLGRKLAVVVALALVAFLGFHVVTFLRVRSGNPYALFDLWFGRGLAARGTLEGGASPAVRAVGAEMVGDLTILSGSLAPADVAALERALADEAPLVRTTAAIVLLHNPAEWPLERALPALVELLEDRTEVPAEDLSAHEALDDPSWDAVVALFRKANPDRPVTPAAVLTHYVLSFDGPGLLALSDEVFRDEALRRKVEQAHGQRFAHAPGAIDLERERALALVRRWQAVLARKGEPQVSRQSTWGRLGALLADDPELDPGRHGRAAQRALAEARAAAAGD